MGRFAQTLREEPTSLCVVWMYKAVVSVNEEKAVAVRWSASWLLRCRTATDRRSNGSESDLLPPASCSHTISHHATLATIHPTTTGRRRGQANEAHHGGRSRSGCPPFLLLGFPAAKISGCLVPPSPAAAATGTTEARVVHQDVARAQGSRGVADGGA